MVLGDAQETIDKYTKTSSLSGKEIILTGIERQGPGTLVFEKLSFQNYPIEFGEVIKFKLRLQSESKRIFRDLEFGIAIRDRNNTTIIHCSNRFIGKNINHTSDENEYVFEISNSLKPDTSSLPLFLRCGDVIQDWISNAIKFEILDGNPYNFSDTKPMPCSWSRTDSSGSSPKTCTSHPLTALSPTSRLCRAKELSNDLLVTGVELEDSRPRFRRRAGTAWISRARNCAFSHQELVAVTVTFVRDKQAHQAWGRPQLGCRRLPQPQRRCVDSEALIGHRQEHCDVVAVETECETGNSSQVKESTVGSALYRYYRQLDLRRLNYPRHDACHRPVNRAPDEAVKKMPQISSKDLYGGIYLPRDGQLDPYITTTSMAKFARELGVEVYTNTRVTGIELSPKGEVQAVVTDKGTIKCEIVTYAAGLWGPRICAMVGLYVPTTPVDHQHIALKAVPGHEFTHETPCLRDPDNLVYMRQEAGGLVIGGYEPNPIARWIDAVPWEHGGRTLPSNFDQFEMLLEGAIRRLPFLDQAGIITLVNHPGAFTPDCQPMLGPMAGVRGLLDGGRHVPQWLWRRGRHRQVDCRVDHWR